MNKILQDKQLIKDAMYAFFDTQVKDILPKGFWADSSVKGFSTTRNMLLDIYDKTEKDDFTVADMLDKMLSEYPLYHAETLRGLPAVMADKTRHILYYLSYSYLYCKDSGLTLEKALETRTEKDSLRYIFFHLSYGDFFSFLAEDSGYKDIIREDNTEVNLFLGSCYSMNCINNDSIFPSDSIGYALEKATDVFAFVDMGYIGAYISEDQYVSFEREARWTVEYLLKLSFMNSYRTDENAEPGYRKMLIPVVIRR